MADSDLRAEKEVEVGPINQNRNQQKNFLAPKPRHPRLATREKVSKQRHQKYNLLSNRHFVESRVKVVSRKPVKSPVMMIHSKVSCHVNVSPGLSHPLLEFDQVQPLDVRDR